MSRGLTISSISMRVVNVAFMNFFSSDNTFYVRSGVVNHVSINTRRQCCFYEVFFCSVNTFYVRSGVVNHASITTITSISIRVVNVAFINMFLL